MLEDESGVSLVYERDGIPIVKLIVKREVAQAALRALPDLLAGGGDAERIDTITEVADMVRCVLGAAPGAEGHVLPLTGPGNPFLEALLAS